MNVPLLRKVQAAILEEPKRLDMGSWAYRTDHVDNGPKCGTVACIAGWAIILNKTDKPARFSLFVHDSSDTCDIAMGLLGLKDDNLFFEDYWPAKFFEPLLVMRPGSRGYAQVVSDYIDHFIAEHGGAE